MIKEEGFVKKILARNIILFVCVLSFGVVLFVSAYADVLINSMLRIMQYNLEQRLRSLSEQAAALTSAGELSRYRRPEDMSLPSYQALRHKLRDFAQRADVTYVYYIRPTEGGKLQYIVDNDFDEATRVGLDTPPYESVPWIESALEGQTTCSGLGNYTPGWEGILTAYSPVYDGEGRAAALAGVDIRDEEIVAIERMMRNLTIIQVITLMMVFMSGLISLISFRQEADRANEASRAKSSFLAQTSHEIRTPMNAVLGMSELALRADSQPKTLEYVRGIKQAGQNLLSIINDILDISKIEAGTLEINPAPYSLASLLNDVINIIRVRVAEKPVVFLVDVDAGIPNNLSGDEARIRQILLNLLTNAVKYTGEGFIRLSLRVEGPVMAAKNINLVLEVADSGIGIREEDIPTLFQRFTRLDMKRNFGVEGTGLGLAITRSLCQAMGGDIGVTSTYGKGSVFSARFPQVCVSEEPLAKVENPAEKGALCCEKEALYAESIVRTLENLGAPVKLCSGIEDLYRELEEDRYPFAFVGAEAAENTALRVERKGLKTTVVALVNSGEMALSGPLQMVLAPFYAVPAANILNNRAAAEPRKVRSGRFAAPNARILVVDDISTNLVVTEGLLASYHSRVDTCTSGAGAIRMIQERRYDLVFMDHMMPEMDGIESTRHIRALEGDYYQRLPVIALTANAISGMKEMFLEQGFNDYLSKPVELAKLDDVMETWIPADKKILKAQDDEGEPDTGGLRGITVEGLDLQMGRERYREKTYLEVLRSYALHTPALLEKLRTLAKTTLSEETVGEYTITVHGLKGSSYGICANGIAKEAEALEQAARNGDLAYIDRENGPFTGGVEALLGRIRGLLAKAVPGAEQKPRAPAPDPVLLKELLEACKRYRANTMEEIVGKLEAFEYETGGDLVVWLREQADNLEYDAVVARLEKLERGPLSAAAKGP